MQALDTSHYNPFLDICQVCDVSKRLKKTNKKVREIMVTKSSHFYQSMIYGRKNMLSQDNIALVRVILP